MNGRTIAAAVLAVASVATAAPVFAQTQAQATAAPYSWASDLLLDHRARRIGDLVTVQITESIAATGSADSNLGKASQSDGKLPWPIPSRFSKALQSSSDTKFTGNGTTSRAASITAIMSVRVTEQLPNGDLAIEGLREIVINGDRQFVTLSGIIRTSDIAAGNVISSAFIADLRIKYFGQGFMKDNLSPGWLMRFLNKIF
jgi:flagellar L-ring protein precursor FlgH